MKRSCRRTAEENRIHDMAVKLRRMTDEQLVKYVDTHRGADTRKPDIPTIMKEIEGIRGVGKTKLHYIHLILKTQLEGVNA